MGLTWQLTTVSHGSHFTPQLTCSPVFVCLQGAVAGARSSKVEDTFVTLWRLFWGGIYKGHSQKRWEEAGRGHKGLKLLGFNTVPCVYRDVLFDFKKPYDSLIFLVDFPAITLTFPPNKNNRGI